MSHIVKRELIQKLPKCEISQFLVNASAISHIGWQAAEEFQRFSPLQPPRSQRIVGGQGYFLAKLGPLIIRFQKGLLLRSCPP